MEDKIQLTLTKSEAIILFEFLSRFGDKNSLRIEDESEKKVLWDLSCDLEKVLAEPFEKNYTEALSKARSSVRNKK